MFRFARFARTATAAATTAAAVSVLSFNSWLTDSKPLVHFKPLVLVVSAGDTTPPPQPQETKNASSAELPSDAFESVNFEELAPYIKEMKYFPMKFIRQVKKNPSCCFCQSEYYMYFLQYMLASAALERGVVALPVEERESAILFYSCRFIASTVYSLSDEQQKPFLARGLLRAEEIEALPDDAELPAFEVIENPEYPGLKLESGESESDSKKEE